MRNREGAVLGDCVFTVASYFVPVLESHVCLSMGADACTCRNMLPTLVCVHQSINGWMGGWMDGWMGGWMDGGMDA